MSTPLHLQALADHAERHRFDRTLLVSTTAGAGRQMLRALTRVRGSWAGLDVTTLRPLALSLARASLAHDQVRVIDSFEEEARIDEALDRALDGAAEGDAFGEVTSTGGFRRAVRGAIQALRLSGVDPARLGSVAFEDPRRGRLIAATLRLYERELATRKETDIAGVMERAVRALEEGCHLPADHILLLPGLSARGVSGELARALMGRGARILPADRVGRSAPSGMLWPEEEGRQESSSGPDRDGAPEGGSAAQTPVPDEAPAELEGLPLFAGAEMNEMAAMATMDAPGTEAPAGIDPDLKVTFLRAAGVHEELREVLRRVMDQGQPFDDVEIVTPDPLVYGPALQSLASRLGIDVTFAVGLPVERTLPGRVAALWLEWITTGYPAALLHRLLQSGDLRIPGRDDRSSRHLARTLRSLRVGWGHDRYLPLIDAALAHHRSAGPRPRRHESAEQTAERHADELRDLEVLRRFLVTLMRQIPGEPTATTPARLAEGLRFVLELIPVESEVDRSARERLVRVLDRVGATLKRTAPFGAALATLRDHIAIRVPAPRVEGRAPWLSDGGALHLTDLEHGGLSARPHTYLVGMDAGRFPIGGNSDPMLLDGERVRIGGGLPEIRQLPRSEDRLAESRFRWEALLSRLRGSVTISHAAWDANEGRVQSPSPVLLDLLRRVGGMQPCGYSELLRESGEPVSRIPRGPGRADQDDLWLALLPSEGAFRDALATLRMRFRGLDRGVSSTEAALHPDPVPPLGILQPRTELDPTLPGATQALSPTALQDLGSCPLRYLYKRVLRIHPPDDPEFDPDQWLTSADRGSLLHTVFERTIAECQRRELEFTDAEVGTLALEILEEEADRARIALPPPSESIHQSERGALRRDIESFCTMLAEAAIAPSDVVALEHDFGFEQPILIPLADGTHLAIKGRVDRIDRIAGGLRVIDYKTGRSDWMDTPELYAGGRRLQHLVYALGISGDDRIPERVARVAYHFPTVRGENVELGYEMEQFVDGAALLTRLVDQIRAGAFVATEDLGDCRFCDYAPICRYRSDDWGNASNPRVTWTAKRIEEGADAVAPLQRVRTFEEER